MGVHSDVRLSPPDRADFIGNRVGSNHLPRARLGGIHDLHILSGPLSDVLTGELASKTVQTYVLILL